MVTYDTRKKAELYTHITSHSPEENESVSGESSSSNHTDKDELLPKDQQDEEKPENGSQLNKLLLEETDENVQKNKSHMFNNWLQSQTVKPASTKAKIVKMDTEEGDHSSGTEEMQEEEIKKLENIKTVPRVQSSKGKEKVTENSDSSDNTEEMPDAEVKKASTKLQEQIFDSDSTEEISPVAKQAENKLKAHFIQKPIINKNKTTTSNTKTNGNSVDDDAKSDGTEEMNQEELFILKTKKQNKN